MTLYISGSRPGGLPPLPLMRAECPTPAMQEAARRFLRKTESLTELDLATLAENRPGVPRGMILTDREFAQAVVQATPGQDELFVEESAPPAPCKAAATVEGDCAKPQPAQGYRVGKLEIGGGNAVLNSQLLRSAAFCAPELGVPLPIVADRNTFEIALEGVSPTQDHADVLLYAISRIEKAPDPHLGTVVTFTTYQLIKAMGWPMNSRGYAQLRAVIRDLSKIALTYYDRADPRNWRVTEGERVFNSVTRPEQNAEDQRWSIVLPPSLFRIFELRRNTLVDLNARAVLQSNFSRWLHAFVSSQRGGESREYDVQALCQAGGLRSARLSDDLKVLRETLGVLESGRVQRKARGGAEGALVKFFDPVVAPGWRLEKAEGRWTLSLTRC